MAGWGLLDLVALLLLFAESATQSFMDEEIKTKLTIAWRAAATRLIDAGYEPRRCVRHHD